VRCNTGVTFNDLDRCGTRISRSSEFYVVDSTEIALNISYKAHIYESGDYRQDNTVVYDRNTEEEETVTRKVDNNPQRYAVRFS